MDKIEKVHKLLKMDGYKSRKFNFACGLAITATALLIGHYIPADTWKEVVESVLGIFALSNVGEKWTVGQTLGKVQNDPTPQ